MNHYSFNPFFDSELEDFEAKVYDQMKHEPLENLFFANFDSIKSNCDTINFNSAKYDMRPDLVSWDNYETLALTNLIMKLNNCFTLFNFTRNNIGPTILIPDRVQIERMLDSQL